MRHFVQYHNPDKFHAYKSSKGEFGIVPNKPVENMRGDMVWLISRRDQPARYMLCDAFVVDEIGPTARGPLKHFANGTEGWFFRRFVVIDDEPRFEKLRKATGNFRFGLQSMRD
jgi:hypothetical protein